MTSSTIGIAIIEDQKPIREGLAALIEYAPGFRCSGAYESMEQALALLDASRTDAVLVDLGLPGMPGIEGIRILRQRYPSLPLLVLSVYDDDHRIFQALCAGACGYLLKKTPPARLFECLIEAVNGGAPMSPEVARRVVDAFRMSAPPQSAPHGLTPHEVRLLRLLVEGRSYQSAGEALGVSINTVRTYIRAIYEKLQVHSKSEAVAKALRERMI